MDGNSSAHEHPVSYLDMAGQHCVVGNNNPVADLDIVRHVHIDH